MKKAHYSKIFLFILNFCGLTLSAQNVINGYANVSAINGTKTILTVNNVNQTFDAFDVGDKIIIMQMQGNVVGSDTLDNSSFGNISAISSVGAYEFATIASNSPSSGTPSSITLIAPLINNFTINNQSSLQIVTFKNLGINFTTTANITGLAWNGFVGGVIAFEVDSNLTLNHSILADGIGFRGGLRSNNFYNGTNTCLGGPFKSGTITTNAYKGEGIYKVAGSTMIAGRGKIANGGGGGGFINCGGAGGGNYSAGGRGGIGWSCTSTTTAGGIGGLALSSFISGSRIFMGGGGGGGQQNDTGGSNGGNGGGIVLIKATTLTTSSLVTGTKLISSNGSAANNSSNDGAGGGGAGGSIIIDIKNYSIASVSPLTIRANGGNGGNCTDGSVHAGGGGGGQGVILYHNVQPTTNITTNTNNGIAGRDNNNGTSFGNSGSGTNNSGVTVISNSPLPIVLLSFEAALNDKENQVNLKWCTASQENNDYFTIERSLDTKEWNEIDVIDGAGTINQLLNYTSIDENPEKRINYYRLKQTDFNGDFTYSKIIAINIKSNLENSIYLYPNPVKDILNIVSPVVNIESISILNANGAVLKNEQFNESVMDKTIDLSTFPSGSYLINIIGDNIKINKKVIIQH